MSDELFHSLLWIPAAFATAGFLLALVRFLLGPSLPDRVAAIDAMTLIAAGLLVIAAIVSGQSLLLDIAIAITLIAFIGTVALAISIQRGIFK